MHTCKIFFYLYKFENKNVFGKKKVKKCINEGFTYAVDMHMSDKVNNGIFLCFLFYISLQYENVIHPVFASTSYPIFLPYSFFEVIHDVFSSFSFKKLIV